MKLSSCLALCETSFMGRPLFAGGCFVRAEWDRISSRDRREAYVMRLAFIYYYAKTDPAENSKKLLIKRII